jgi:hypothetical protein
MQFFGNIRMAIRQNNELVTFVKHKDWDGVARFMQNIFGSEHSREEIECLGLDIYYAEPGNIYKIKIDYFSYEEVGIEKINLVGDDEYITITKQRKRSWSI